MRRLAASAVALLALAATACGGSESAAGEESGATIAPATAPLYFSVDTDLESEQWKQVDRLLAKFPGGFRVRKFLDGELRDEGLDYERDVEPALGPTLEVVVLDLEGENVVGLTQPEDEDKFKTLLEKADDETVSRKIDGWTAIADSAAVLDRFERAQGERSLADGEHFDDAMAELPEDAVAKAYVNGRKLLDQLEELGPGLSLSGQGGRPIAIAAALEAVDEGFRVMAFTRTDRAQTAFGNIGELAELVPVDAFAFLNVSGVAKQANLSEQLRSTPEVGDAVEQLEQTLGVDVDDLVKLFDDEALLYVRPGTVIPEVTLVLAVANEADALRTLDTVAERAGKLTGGEAKPPRRRTIGGVEARVVDFGPFAVLYGTVDGRLVVSSSEEAFSTVGGEELVESDRYEQALEAAGVGDEKVFLYVDLDKSIALVRQLAAFGDEEIPAEVRRYLDPLRSLVISGAVDGKDSTARVFLELE